MSSFHLEIQTHRKNPIGLIRSSFRENGKVKKVTHARITNLSLDTLRLIQASLQGKVILQGDVNIISSYEYGASNALLSLLKELGLDKMIYSKTNETWVKVCIGMIIGRILFQKSKLSLTRTQTLTTLWQQLSIQDKIQDVNIFYEAMDKLSKRQEQIQKQLVKKHLEKGNLVLYDITSSYLEGEYENSQIVSYGYNRDKKKGYEQIVIGLICNSKGCPLIVEVFKGNTKDNQTVEKQIIKITQKYEIETITFVGDRGMIQHDSIEKMQNIKQEIKEKLQSINALRHKSIQEICQEKEITKEKLKKEIIECKSDKIAKRRIIISYNEKRAKQDSQVRQILIEKTIQELEKIKNRKRKVEDAQVGIRVGKIINKYKVGKLIEIKINQGKLEYKIKQEEVEKEERYDGIYAVTTDVEKEKMTSKEVIKSYKRLTEVEQAFRQIKGEQIEIRPIYHKTDERIKSHVFICMLSYYILWNLNQKLKPLYDKNKKGKDYKYTIEYVLEQLKAIRQEEIEVLGSKITKISKASEEQEEILKLLR